MKLILANDLNNVHQISLPCNRAMTKINICLETFPLMLVRSTKINLYQMSLAFDRAMTKIQYFNISTNVKSVCNKSNVKGLTTFATTVDLMPKVKFTTTHICQLAFLYLYEDFV